jgi:hypothetical protein
MQVLRKRSHAGCPCDAAAGGWSYRRQLPECNVALVPTQVKKFMSGAGCLAIIFVVIGVIALPFGVIPGLILMAIGVVVGATAGKETLMVCPKCAGRGATISG